MADTGPGSGDRPSREAPALGRLAFNTVAQAAGTVGTAALGFLTFLIVARALGPSGYGAFTVATIFLFIPVVLADVGLGTSVLREISRTPRQAEWTMRRALPVRILVSSSVLGVALILSIFLPLEAAAKTAILIGAPGALLVMLNVSLLPLLALQLRMHVSAVATMLGRLVTLGLSALAAGVDLGLKSFVLATVVGAAVTLTVNVAVIRRSISLRPIVDFPYWKWLVRDSFAIGLSNSLYQSYFRIDTLILSVLRPVREVGLYGVAYKFVEIAEALIASVGTSLFPTLTQLAADADPRLPRVIQRAFDLVVALTAPLAVAMLVAPADLVAMTAGSSFGGAAVVVQLLAPYLLLVVLSGIVFRTLAALHADRALLVNTATVLAFNVALNFLLIPLYGFKVAAVASIASEAVFLGVAGIQLFRRLRFVPSIRYGAVVLPAAAAMTATVLLTPGHALARLVLGGVAYLVVVTALPGTVHDIALGLCARTQHSE